MAPPTWSSLTKTIHRTEYPAISPLNPANSAAGKTVVITGGATGIGFAIARAFLRASARTVVLLARRSAVLAEAAAKLRAEFPRPQAEGEDKRVLTYSCDLNDEARIREIFADVRLKINKKSVPSTTTTEEEDDGELDIDILVLSAAFIEQGLPTNVLGNLNAVRAFVPEAAAVPVPDLAGHVRQPRPEAAALAAAAAATKKKSTAGGDRVVVDISSVSAYVATPTQSLYGASKLPFAFFVRHLQPELDRLAALDPRLRPVRVHSLHPGGVFTEAAREVGFTEDSFPWDDASLPAGFAVWLASAQAAFLKGRFVHASWSVEELVGMKGRLEEDKELATIVLKV